MSEKEMPLFLERTLSAKPNVVTESPNSGLGNSLAGTFLFVFANFGLYRLLAPSLGEGGGRFVSYLVAALLSYPALGQGRLMLIKRFGEWTFIRWFFACVFLYGCVRLLTNIVLIVFGA